MRSANKYDSDDETGHRHNMFQRLGRRVVVVKCTVGWRVVAAIVDETNIIT